MPAPAASVACDFYPKLLCRFVQKEGIVEMIQQFSMIDLEKRLIRSIIEIDSLAFAESLQGSFEEEYDRFTANRDAYVFLYDDDRMAGYLTLFPIKPELHKRIISEDRVFDSDIPGSMIEQYQPSQIYDLYLLSVAVRPEYQGRGLSRHLIKGFYEYLLNKRSENIHFSSILSTAMTDEGRRFLEKIGLRKKRDLPGGHDLYELIVDESTYSTAEAYLAGASNSPRVEAAIIHMFSMKDMDTELLKGVLGIDSQVYPSHLLTTVDEAYDRLEANRDMFALLYDSKRLIGYMCVFPVKPFLYERIISEDRLFDSDITGDMIEVYHQGRAYNLYLLSVAILPEYQGRGLAKQFTKWFFNYLLEKRSNNIYFSSALSVAISKEGRLLLEKMGFRKKKGITGGYTLLELTIDEHTYKLAEGYISGK